MSTSLLVAVREYFLYEYFFSLSVEDRKYPKSKYVTPLDIPTLPTFWTLQFHFKEAAREVGSGQESNKVVMSRDMSTPETSGLRPRQ